MVCREPQQLSVKACKHTLYFQMNQCYLGCPSPPVRVVRAFARARKNGGRMPWEWLSMHHLIVCAPTCMHMCARSISTLMSITCSVINHAPGVCAVCMCVCMSSVWFVGL